jgi:malate dehydrogenase (oxaloacetate-decarboxylating)(NADP+)
MAKIEMRRRLTLIGAMLLQKDQVDGMICGTWGTTDIHLRYVDQVIGKRAGREHLRLHERAAAAQSPGFPGRYARQLRPDAEQLAEITQMARRKCCASASSRRWPW